MRLLRLVSEAANAATSVQEPLQSALDAICDITGWPVGHVYMMARDRDEMTPTDLWHLDDPARFEKFRRATMATRMPRGTGLPGRILETRRPLWIDDVSADENFPRNLAGPLALRSAFGFPVCAGREVTAVLEFFTPKKVRPDPEFLDLMMQVGVGLGRTIERVRAEEALANVARAVTEKTGAAFFDTLCRQLVRTLDADVAFIGELRDDGRSINTVAACGPAGPIEEFTYRLDGTPCENVISRQFCSHPSGVQQMFPHDRMLADMGIETYVGTPLMDTDGRALGLLVVLWKTPPANIRIAESMAQIFAVRASTEMQRRRSEGALRKFATLPEVSPHPMVEFDGGGALRFCNEAALRLMKSLGKKDPWEILPADTVDIVRRCTATGKNGLVFDTVGGENRTISWSFIPIPSSDAVYAHAFELSLFMDLREELYRQTGTRPGHLPTGRPKGGQKIDIPDGKVH